MGIQQRWIYIAATIVAGSSFIVSALVCSAILWSPKTRTIGFNLYLVALILPDVIVNLTDLIIRCIGLSEDKTMVMISYFGCVFNTSIHTYYILTNVWTSALICKEVHQLLVKSNNAKKFILSPRTVIKRVLILNCFLILGVLAMYAIVPLFGIKIGKALCLYIWQEGTFLFLIILSCFTINLPIIYILYIAVDVYRKNLLPTTDQSRFIATFFIRTSILTTIFTVVVSLLIIIVGDETNHLFDFTKSGQGLIIAGFSMMKPDIRRSVLHFVSCGMLSMPEERVSGSILISFNTLTETNHRLSNLNFSPSDIIEENIDSADMNDGKPRTIDTKENSFDLTIESNSTEVQLDI